MTGILLGHRNQLMQAALAALIADEADLEVVAELSCTENVLAEVSHLRPQVVVLDCMLPGVVTVPDVCVALCRQPSGPAALVLLDRRSYRRLGRALVRLAPQVGLIGIDTSAKDFVEGIRRLVRGEPVLDPDLAVAALRSGDSVLTARECDVLRQAALGATSMDIAANLNLSTGTVRNYLSRILTKLDARTRIEAIRIAQDAGWI